MSFDPKTGGPCYRADIRRGAFEQIDAVLRGYVKWQTDPAKLKQVEQAHAKMLEND